MAPGEAGVTGLQEARSRDSGLRLGQSERHLWGTAPRVLFVLLNTCRPDDLTVTRSVGFARAWGFDSMASGNLFTLQISFPALLAGCADPVGPGNDDWLTRLRDESSLAVEAWGNHGRPLVRSTAVRAMFPGSHILGLTALGEPRHPLYVRADVSPRPWPTATD
jgi:hypothetical protein